jgi:hypothetical protein
MMAEKDVREGSIWFSGTHIGIWEEKVDMDSYRIVYQAVVRHFRDRGFIITVDPHAKKNYPAIAQYYHLGKKGILEVHTQMSGRHIEINFFQNINVENKNGGRYDSDKFEKMPYLIKKQFIIEASKVIDMLFSRFGYSWKQKLNYATDIGTTTEQIVRMTRGISPSREPLKHFNERWEAGRFKRDETGWPTDREYDYGSDKDREGIALRNGMFRYLRDRRGYLKRGIIYTNMNKMWQLIFGPAFHDSTWVHCSELFTLQAGDSRRRHFPDHLRLEKMQQEMARAVKDQRFEKAAILRDLIKAMTAKEAIAA